MSRRVSDRIKQVMDPATIPAAERRKKARRSQDRWRIWGNRMWLAFNTAILIWLTLTIQHTLNTQDRDRINGTTQRCALIQTITDTAVDLGVDRRSPNLDRLALLHDQCEALLTQLKNR